MILPLIFLTLPLYKQKKQTMKKFIMALLFAIITVGINAQIQPPMGLAWNSTFATVNSTITSTYGGTYSDSQIYNSDLTMYFWDDVVIGATSYSFVSAIFLNGKLVKIILATQGTNNWWGIKSDHTDFVTIFNNKHGKSDKLHQFTSPYEEGDGYERLAFKLEKAMWFDIWVDVYENSLAVQIKATDYDMYITITYEHYSFGNYLDSKAKEGL